jgi:lipopolysaccharide export system protein LptA
VKKLLILFCCFITVFAYSAPEKTKKVITFKADIASYQEVKSKNVFKGQGNAYLEIDDYKIYCEEIEIHFFKDKNGEDQIEKALFNKTIRIFNDKDQVQIGGEEAEYYREEKKFVIRNNAFYTDSKEEVAVFGDTIYNYDEEKVTIIQGNSRIYQKDIFAKGAFVKYTKSDKQMSISGFPTVRNQGSEYSARKIIVDVEHNTFILQGDLSAEILNNDN